MKKFLISFLILTLSLSTLFAQMTLEPDHPFYTSLQSWQNRGIVDELPPTRPYPASTIKEILELVMEEGSDKDKESAEIYWQEITGKAWQLYLKTEENLKIQDSKTSNYLNITPMLKGNINLFNDYVNFAYGIGWSIRNVFKLESFIPSYSNYSSDARFDPAVVKNFNILLEGNDLISYRNKGLILQAGVFRNGYGDFLNEGLALSDTAYHKPTILLSYTNQKLSYIQSFSMLGATLNDYHNVRSQDTKYLSFHAFEYKPWNWISASFYETGIYGKRFDFSYLLPVPYMIAQSFSDYADSIMMGARLKLLPVSSLALKTDLLVDDLSVNDLFKLKLNSKNRIAWNFGIDYTPEPNFINSISLNCLIVTPYTYTHWDTEARNTREMTPLTINYQNYTNCGFPIGTNIPPNSTQFKLDINLAPVKNLNVNLFASFVLHANIIETLTDDEQLIYALAQKNIYSTDGSIFTHPFTTKGYLKTSWNYMNFLNQEHKMSVFQTGLNATYKLFTNRFGTFSFKTGYIFEMIKNKGVDANIYPGLNDNLNLEDPLVYDKDNNTYSFTASDGKEFVNASPSEILNYYQKQWISNFHNQTQNYIYLSFEYRF